jgi:hypothetical protein
VLEEKGLRNYGTDPTRSEQAGHGGDQVDKKNDQIAHRRMVAGQGILRNHGRNNNSPATSLHHLQHRWKECHFKARLASSVLPFGIARTACNNDRGPQSDRCGATAKRLVRSFVGIQQTRYRRRAIGTPAHSCPQRYMSCKMR